MNRQEKLGLMAGLLAVCCWSGFVLVARHGGQTPLLPWDQVALRFGVGGLLLLPWARRWFVFHWKGLVLVLVGGLGYGLTVYQGFKLTSAVHASVLLPGMIPFAAALFCVLLLRERPGGKRLAGLTLIGAGCALMLDSGGHEGVRPGDLWLLAAVSAWGCYTVLIRRWRIAPLSGAVTTAVGAAALYLPVYVSILPHHINTVGWPDLLLQAFYQGIIATIVAMLLYLRAVVSIGPAAMGALMALVPVLSGLAAVPILGENLDLQETAALLITSLGALLASGLLRRQSLTPQWARR